MRAEFLNFPDPNRTPEQDGAEKFSALARHTWRKPEYWIFPARLIFFDFWGRPDQEPSASGIFDGTFADGSGGSSAQIRFVSPSGQIVDGVFDILHPVSGDRLDGIYQAKVTLGSAAEAGIWQVQYLLLNDEAGNTTWLSPTNSAALAALSFSVGNEGSDTTAPALSSISLSTTSLNIGAGQTSLFVTAHFTDDLSGIFDGTFADGSGGSSAQIRFVSPSGQIVDGVFDILHPVSGDRLDGIYQAKVTLG